MSVTKPKLSLEKVLHLLRKPDARLVRLHSDNDGAGTLRLAARRSSLGWVRATVAGRNDISLGNGCFPATLRAGAWAIGVTGPNVREGGPVSHERPFGGLHRGQYGGDRRGPAVVVRALFREGHGPLSRPALRHHGRGRDRAVAG